MRLDDRHLDYLGDESRLRGWADEIYFPASTDEAAAIIALLDREAKPWTGQGGRTGIYGGAVPHGGAVVNLSRHAGLVRLRELPGGQFALTVGAGATLQSIKRFCRARRRPAEARDAESRRAIAAFARSGPLFLPIEPSEDTATMGGVVAADAKGCSVAQFGGVRDIILGLMLVQPDGTLRAVRAGDDSGLLARLCGAGDSLGLVAEVELRLIPEPAERWGAVFFFAHIDAARDFSVEVAAANPGVDCLLLDSGTLSLLRRFGTRMDRLRELLDLPAGSEAAVFVELSADSGEGLEKTLETLLDRFAAIGGREDDTWAESGHGLERLRLLYHAAIELSGVNLDERRRAAPELHRQCLDFVAPPSGYACFLAAATSAIAAGGMEASSFAWTSRSHLHVELFPFSSADAEKAAALLESILILAADAGGGVGTEFGRGPLKQASESHPSHIPENRRRAAPNRRRQGG